MTRNAIAKHRWMFSILGGKKIGDGLRDRRREAFSSKAADGSALVRSFLGQALLVETSRVRGGSSSMVIESSSVKYS